MCRRVATNNAQLLVVVEMISTGSSPFGDRRQQSSCFGALVRSGFIGVRLTLSIIQSDARRQSQTRSFTATRFGASLNETGGVRVGDSLCIHPNMAFPCQSDVTGPNSPKQAKSRRLLLLIVRHGDHR
jgi:hypothetical protein